MKNNTKNGVLILECIDQSDPGSEGRFLSHMFDIMQVQSQYVEVRTSEQLLSLMGCSPYDYIHVTTHGHISKKKFAGWWVSNGNVSKEDLKKWKSGLVNKTIVSTACKSGMKAFGKYVIGELGCKYYLAPAGSPKFRNSIMFAHVFYHKLFVLNRGVTKSYEAYERNYKNPHRFIMYSRKKRFGI